MKKTIAMMLAVLAVMAVVLCGCGKAADEKTSTEGTTAGAVTEESTDAVDLVEREK